MIDRLTKANTAHYTPTTPGAKQTKKQTQTDTLNISSATNQRLGYAKQLAQGMVSGPGNGNPDASGTPIQILNALLFNTAITFGEIASRNGNQISLLWDVFREKVHTLFDDTVMAIHRGTEDADELEQVRTEARALADTFLQNFFTSFRTITGQCLSDTQMTRGELAFHESWNHMYFAVGAEVIGGSAQLAGSGEDAHPLLSFVPQTDEEFRRATLEMLREVARQNAEVFRQWAEMHAEEAERWRKIMEIAARLSAGGNVSAEDRAFLMQNSPAMYIMAMMSNSDSSPDVSDQGASRRQRSWQQTAPVPQPT